MKRTSIAKLTYYGLVQHDAAALAAADRVFGFIQKNPHADSK